MPRPRSRGTARPTTPARERGELRPSQVETTPPSSPTRAASSTSAHGPRVGATQARDEAAGLARRGAVHGAEERDLRLLTGGDGTAVDDARVEVPAARRRGECGVARHRGQHARLQLRDVGHDEPPAGIGPHRLPQLARELERAAAGGRPAAGDDATGDEDGAEPAVGDPFREPRPPVGREQSRELLVLEQRLDDRMPLLGELPPARGLDQHADAVQRAQQLGLRVEARRRVAERRAHALRGVGELRRRAATGTALPQRLDEDPVVRDGVPREPSSPQLGGDERARRLRRGQQAQAAGIRCCPRSPRAGAGTRPGRPRHRTGARRDAARGRDRTTSAPPPPRRRVVRHPIPPPRRTAADSSTSAESRRMAWQSRRS